MTELRVKQFFGWLRTVEISESIKNDYSSVSNYLKSNERIQRIIEMEYFVINAVSENLELSAKLDRLSHSNEKLIQRVIELENVVDRV